MLLQFLGYGFVIAVYGLFAWFGKAPVDGFIAVLTGAIAMLGGVHAYSTASKRATDAANLANPVPPPKSVPAPTNVTQSGFANPFLLLSIVITILLAVSLVGCANMTQGEQSALNATMEVLDDTADIAVSAAVLDADLHEPDPWQSQAHRDWCAQHPNHPHCH